MKKVIFFLLLIFFALSSFYFLFERGKKKEEDVLFLSGNVEVTEVDVGFKMAGIVEKIFVSEGDRIKKGQVLAKLEGKDYENALRQQRAILEEARLRLIDLKKGAREEEIERAKANVEANEAELVRLEKEYRRAERLLKEGACTLTYFENAKAAYESRKALLKNAIEYLNLLKKGPREEEIRIAEKKVEQAEIALEIASQRLKDTILKAPIDGVILKKMVEEGEIVSASMPVFTIGDLERPWIKVYVPEDKLGMIRLGLKALVFVDTFKGKSYEGKVSYISKEAEFTPKTVQTKEERVRLVFGVKISVSNENQELKPGMPADVRIILNGR